MGITNLPPEQAAIRAKCFHPSGAFGEFPEAEIERSIPARFEKIVRRYPQRLAVRTKNRSLTYAELNKAANHLARAILGRRGQGQEPVGLFLNDGVRLITAHVAVLKAGKFSLGLDPFASPARTAHFLEDSQTALVVSDAETEPVARHWAFGEKQLINLDELDSAASEDNIGLPISSNAYCYLRYTSGSTGQAKGAVKTHRHVLHAVMNATNYFHICAADRSMLLSRASSFGKYAFEVLLNGAALCPFYVKEEGLIHLADWLIQQQITFYYSFPTAFRHFLSALSDRKNFSKLRLIRLEGEPVYRSDIELYRKHFSSNCLLVNSFSSTETGPISLYFLDQESDVSGTCVPAGYPVDGMQVLLLDECGKEVGPNQPGEIAVRSRFLSSGYWRRAELTREKFVTETETPEEQLYLTGDLAELSEDGCLELLGRKDFQVKIRSFRVDTGEVEAVLALHPEIKEVSVVGSKDHSDNTRLIAYLVPHSHPAPTVTNLRDFLKERLPDYMVPSAFVTLDKLPLLSTGKVDRRALPDPGKSRPDLDTPSGSPRTPELDESFSAPRTPIEKKLAGIWSKLLGLNQVGVRDNFFDLGGHSLLAVRLFAEIEKAFNQRPSLSSLFQDGTIEHLAKIIARKTPLGNQSCLVPIQPHGSKLPFFCVHEFFGDVLCYINIAGHLGQDQPFYALQPVGLDNGEEPFNDIVRMAAHYIEQIWKVQPRGPYALGGLCFGGLVAFEMAQQLQAKGESVSLVALLDSGVRSDRDKAVWWRTVPMAIPSWLKGALQLNGSQWLDLAKLRHRQLKAKLADRLWSRNGNSRQHHGSTAIDEMADLLGFSEQHRKIAYAQHQAIKRYTPRTYLGQLTLFRAQMQPLFSSHKPDKGWRRFAAGGLDIKVIPGNHLGMLQEPHVKILAKELRACLDRANRG